MSAYSQHFKNTPQSEALIGKTMIKGPAGGFVFQIDDWQRLKRFLILGTDGGGYYDSERKLTLESAVCIQRCLKIDGARAINMIVEVSDGGLAPKNDSAVFALACATKFGDELTRKLAFSALPKVCRIGTHIFQFTEFREALGGGWGRGAREAVAKWYTERKAESLVTQALKFQQRNGWSHADLLRLSHAKSTSVAHRAIFSAIQRPEGGPERAPSKKGQTPTVRSTGSGWEALRSIPMVEGYLRIRKAENAAEAATFIESYKLPRELVPTQFLTEAPVWAALLPHMPMNALARNLGNLSKCGLLKPLSEASKIVAAKFADQDEIQKSRLHPFAILLAAKIYASGHGVRGGGQWTVVPQVVTALDHAFELAFKNVKPTGKRHFLGVDVSGSMSMNMGGVTPMTCAEAAAAMALVTARVEPEYFIGGFSTHFKDLGITAKDSLPDVLRKTSDHNFGGTDTSVAIKYALANKIEAEVFVVYTDSDTWAGDQHTCQSIVEYRKKTGIPAKLAVVAFTGHDRSVADSADAGSMDFVGMDASMPQALAAFVGE